MPSTIKSVVKLEMHLLVYQQLKTIWLRLEIQHNPYNGSYRREGGSSHPWGCLANIWIEITKSNKIIVYNQRWDQRTDWLLIHKSSTSITSLCTHKNHNVCCNVSSVFRQKKLLFAKNTKKTREGATVDVAYDYVMSWCNK